jgi:acetyl-CoA carboxylase biotin carboxylase subunit
VDLVQEQIRVADHQPLRLSQDSVRLDGHAIECRINAESPFRGFSPFPGRIDTWIPPQASGIRVDSHCYSGYIIPPYYDSLIGKLISKGADRPQAIERMQSALDKFVISGVDTTIPFHQMLLKDQDFTNGKVNTRWLEDVVLPKIRRRP